METITADANAGDRIERIFLVMNPVAGATDCESARDTISDYFSSQNIDYEFYFTRKEDDIYAVVSKAIDNGFTRIAAVGGDGTVSQVASALINRNIPLGILPAGSGNVLARGLGIPISLPEALDILHSSQCVRTIDAMKAGEKYYFLNVSAGISSITMLKTRRRDKRRFGMLAYLWRGLENLSRFRPHLFRIKVDGVEQRIQATEVLIANASFMGINPYTSDRTIRPDDGVLDICIVLSKRISDIPALAVELVTRRPTPFPTLECRPAQSEIVLDAFRRLPVQADGELAGYTPMTIKILPQALQVIVPNID